MIIDLLFHLQKNSKLKKYLKQKYFFKFVKRIYRALISFFGKNGLKLKIKDVSAKIIVTNPAELNYYFFFDNEKEFLEKLLVKINNTTVFYDVGAYIGLYSLSVAKYKIRPKFIYCFEPEPFNFKRLNENIKLNQIKNIAIFQNALGNENGISQMATEATEPGFSTSSFAIKSPKSIPVHIVRGDDFILKKKLYLPSIIKIDVEGYELNVLKGFEQTIKKSHPIIFLEIHPIYLKNLGFSREQVLNFLYNIKYKITFSSFRKKEEHCIFEPIL